MIVLNILTILPEEVSLRVMIKVEWRSIVEMHFVHREKNGQCISSFDPTDDSIEQDRSNLPIESIVSVLIFQRTDS